MGHLELPPEPIRLHECTEGERAPAAVGLGARRRSGPHCGSCLRQNHLANVGGFVAARSDLEFAISMIETFEALWTVVWDLARSFGGETRLVAVPLLDDPIQTQSRLSTPSQFNRSCWQARLQGQGRPTMPDKPLPTDLELTALDPIFREHPHDRLDRLRNEDPVYLDAELGRLFLTRFEDMRAVLADRSLSNDMRKAPDTPRRRALMGDVPPQAFEPSKILAAEACDVQTRPIAVAVAHCHVHILTGEVDVMHGRGQPEIDGRM